MLVLVLVQLLVPSLLPVGILLCVSGSDAAEGVEISQAQQSAIDTTAPLRLQQATERPQLFLTLSEVLQHCYALVALLLWG